MTTLTEEISTLYKLFSGYKYNPKMIFCEHCKEKTDVEMLGKKKLKTLNGDELKYYIAASMTTMGTVDDFKHFIPRIIELFFTDIDSLPIDLELLASKLVYAKWFNWPDNEKNSIRSVFKKYWEMQFEKYESDEDKVPSIFEIIGAICLLEEDLEPYLDIWQEKIINTDYRYFLDVVLEVFPHIQNKESLNPYLDRSRINENKLREWIKINIDKEGFKKYINLFPKGKMWRLDSIYYELIKFENS